MGRQQIAGIPTAINELIKNAHDAYADKFDIDFLRCNNLLVLRDDGLGMTKEEFETHLEERLDTHSLIDYFIFINLLMAYDNTGRNIFWAIYNIKAPEGSRFLILPWDLDGTLGRTWDAVKLDPEKGLGFDNGLTLRNDGNSKYFRPFERIIDENPNNIKQRIYERFIECKNKALSLENMAAKVDYYKRQIVESGALTRDYQKWSEKWMYGYAAPDEEAEYMKKWYTARLKYLEKIFQNL